MVKKVCTACSFLKTRFERGNTNMCRGIGLFSQKQAPAESADDYIKILKKIGVELDSQLDTYIRGLQPQIQENRH